MKAESWKIPSSGKFDVTRVKDSLLFELASVLVRLDHVASFIVNANHSLTAFDPSHETQCRDSGAPRTSCLFASPESYLIKTMQPGEALSTAAQIASDRKR
jgi:hypothetical protein